MSLLSHHSSGKKLQKTLKPLSGNTYDENRKRNLCKNAIIISIMHINGLCTMQGLFFLYVIVVVGIVIYQMKKTQEADGKSSAKK